ncbi:MAG: hypothetical protein MCM46_16345 [Candidatus Manganitrophus sp. SB1]|nr:hypothetical protein [Candidatus Manganitrophus morganii]
MVMTDRAGRVKKKTDSAGKDSAGRAPLGVCPHCKAGGIDGDHLIVALYWDSSDRAFRCVYCGYWQ